MKKDNPTQFTVNRNAALFAGRFAGALEYQSAKDGLLLGFGARCRKM